MKRQNYFIDILYFIVYISLQEQPHSIFIKSKFGQDYSCLLPAVENDDISKTESIGSEKNIDIKDLLKPIQSGSCILKVKIIFGNFTF